MARRDTFSLTPSHYGGTRRSLCGTFDSNCIWLLRQSKCTPVLELDPNLFIFLGDNIYADIKQPNKMVGRERTVGPFKNIPRFWAVSPEELKLKYDLLKHGQPGYVALRKKTQIVGTWDDHDYGLNDAGKEYEGKDASQQLMLDFLDEAPDSQRRKQQGVYAAYTYGPVGKKVKVIVS